MAESLLVISPVHNEAAHLAEVARAVAAQTRPPDLWVVVDDASTDGTFELAAALAVDIPFMRVIRVGPQVRPAPAKDRLAMAAAPRTFNAGLRSAPVDGFTHIAKLDGDIELPPRYFEVLLEQFAIDAELGLAGGVLVERAGDGWKRLRIPAHHVHGALKCYSAECFRSIGGVQERLGWDTIDGTYARMRGFRTQSFPDLVAVHHRPWASADGLLRGRARHGRCAYISHYSLPWVMLRSLKVARSRPVGLSGAAFLYGYVEAIARSVPRVEDPAFRTFTRRELRGRMLGTARIRAARRSGRPPARTASAADAGS